MAAHTRAPFATSPERTPRGADIERQLRLEKQPLSPTYMSYIYQQDAPAGAISTARPRPYQPATQLSAGELLLETSQGIYEHFHAPCNDHNKFLNSVRDEDKYAYRDLPRMSPPPFDKSGRSSIRAQSAGPSRSRRVGTGATSPKKLYDTTSMSLADRTVTLTGAPCYTTPALLPADVQQGCPVMDPESLKRTGEGWRVAYVKAYAVPASTMGYGEGGQRPFHQDYRHYKYYGYAGKGAKTSWAHNPKLDENWRQTRSARVAVSDSKSTPREAGSPLTKTEARLVEQFKDHAYSAEKPPVELIEPYLEWASLESRGPLSKKEIKDKTRYDKCRVATYRQPVPAELTLSENPSPNHGSQSPFHQRYSHYRYHGFGGKGATSSWARNPKYAVLYDS